MMITHPSTNRAQRRVTVYATNDATGTPNWVNKSGLDKHCRNVEHKLRQTAEEFAKKYGLLEELKVELS